MKVLEADPAVISKALKDGHSLGSLMEQYNVSRGTLLTFMQKNGISTPRAGHPTKRVDVSSAGSVDFRLSDRQQTALSAEEPFVMYGGAKGGGKSWFLCVWIFLMAVKYKGNKLFFCRRRSVDFTNTTLETWKKAIPSKLYRINEQKKKIYIDRTGSVIDFGGLDDPLTIQSLNSAEYAHIGVDQAEEVDRESFAMLRGTLRHRLPDGTFPPFLIRLTANPAQCWLKEVFIVHPQPGFRYIQALPTDNPMLPKSYVGNLEEAFKHRPELLAAYLHGSWDELASDDIIIQGKWVEESKNRKFYGPALKRLVVNDPARYGDDENVTYVMEMSGNGIIHVVERVVVQHKSLMDTAGRLAALRKKWDAQIIVIDCIGIGAGVVDALYELGEPILQFNSSKKPTIETNQTRYFNLRTQMWVEGGKKFSEGLISVDPDDYVLTGQLSSCKYEYSSDSRIKAESKEEIKKRLGGSPDRADSFLMGVFAFDVIDQISTNEVVHDVVGRGERVGINETDYVSAGEDFSGYNFS